MHKLLSLSAVLLCLATAQTSFADEPFCAGDAAMYHHYKVTILEVYPDNTANIRYSSGSAENVSIRSLERPVNSALGFRVGDKVMYGHYNVTVVAVYPDSTVDIRYSSGSTENVSARTLNWPISSIDGFSVGEKALRGHYKVTILETFIDHTANIRYNSGSTENVSTRSLSKFVSNANGFFPGDVAMYGHYKVTVLEVYPDNTADIRYSSGSTENVSARRLERPVTSIDGFSVGQRALKGHYKVIILAVYSDSTADVQYTSGSTENVSTRSLSRPVRCGNDGRCSR